MSLTPLMAMNSLREVAEKRASLIATSKERYAAVDTEAKAKKAAIRKEHRNANRELVAMVRQAQNLGIHVEDSAKIIGMSAQALYRIEQELRKYDQAHSKED